MTENACALLFGVASVAIDSAGKLPYLLSTVRGTTRPHPFSWAIWILLGAVASAAQFVAGAGPGAWATFSSTAFGVLILLACARTWRRAAPTRKDWMLFAGILAAIPAWIATRDELWAVAICSAVNCSAYWFTFANVVREPEAERVDMYAACCARGILSLLANSVQSLSTALYPATSLLLNAATCVLVVAARRRAQAAASQER